MRYLTALIITIAALGNATNTTKPTTPIPTITITHQTTTTTTTTPETITNDQHEIKQRTPQTTTTTIPTWTGKIHEEYGPGTGCTQEQANIIANEMRKKGATDKSIEWMLYIISRESTCNSAAHNGNRNTMDDSYGLCQQNNLSGWFDKGQLLENYDRYAFATNFQHNAEACAHMWATCSKGPWTRGDYSCYTPQELKTTP